MIIAPDESSCNELSNEVDDASLNCRLACTVLHSGLCRFQSKRWNLPFLKIYDFKKWFDDQRNSSVTRNV